MQRRFKPQAASLHKTKALAQEMAESVRRRATGLKCSLVMPLQEEEALI